MRVLLAVLVIAAPLRAGVIYDFVTTVEMPHSSISLSGSISVEGQMYRAQFAGPALRGINLVISRDGDATAMFVNLSDCSWSYRARMGPIRSSAYFHLPADGGDVVIGKPVVTHRIEGTETIGRFEATRHVIDIQYRLLTILADTPARGSVVARATILTIDTLPPLPMRRDLATGHPAIDQQLATINEQLHGMICGHDLEVTRMFDGGIGQTEHTVTRVRNLRVLPLPDSLFALPSDAAYVQRGPGS